MTRGSHRRGRLADVFVGSTAFAVLVGGAVTGVLFRSFSTPSQLAFFAAVYLLISWVLGHLFEQAPFAIGCGVLLGGLTAAMLVSWTGPTDYALPLILMAVAGGVAMRLELLERRTP